MKKSMLLGALLVAVVTTGYFVSGTYAKYTSTFEGSTSTARVAKWAFTIDNEGNTALANNFTFNLFETIVDTVDGNADQDVANSAKIIAPGTKGSFNLKFYNKSEVNAEYTIDYTVDNAGVPIEYSIDGSTWTTDLADITTPVAIAMGANADINIQWRWTFEADDETETSTLYSTRNDESDTTLGIAGSATPTVKANITVTQVD